MTLTFGAIHRGLGNKTSFLQLIIQLAILLIFEITENISQNLVLHTPELN